MENYGSSMIGSFVSEKVQTLPTWTKADTGRFLYDYDTNNYYLGAINYNIGANGWIPVGLTTKAVKSYQIDWDVNLTNRYGSVSAKHVPVLYENKPNDLQSVINIISDKFELLKKGDYTVLGYASIKSKHLLITGPDAITAKSIPIVNEKNIFPDTNNSGIITIEDALNYAGSRTAEKINLEDTTKTKRKDYFGTVLGFDSKTVQAALEDLEKYIGNISAADIPCTYEGCNCKTNVQFVLDALYKLYSDCKFVDLIDAPSIHDPKKKYLKSDGSTLIWTQLLATDTMCKYPNLEETSVQAALRDLNTRVNQNTIALANLKISASNVIHLFTGNGYTFNNVGTALDLIFNDFYNPQNPPNAKVIPCTVIGSATNTNVQAVLNYLNTELNKCLASIPCTVAANDISYNSKYGNSNVANALTYILGFIDYAINGYGMTYPKFNPA